MLIVWKPLGIVSTSWSFVDFLSYPLRMWSSCLLPVLIRKQRFLTSANSEPVIKSAFGFDSSVISLSSIWNRHTLIFLIASLILPTLTSENPLIFFSSHLLDLALTACFLSQLAKILAEVRFCTSIFLPQLCISRSSWASGYLRRWCLLNLVDVPNCLQKLLTMSLNAINVDDDILVYVRTS